VTREERQSLRALALAAIEATRDRAYGRRAAQPSAWELQTSNSFRRIGARGDGDVLCATTHPRDHHPDLLAAPSVLDYIVAAQPRTMIALLDALDAAEDELEMIADLEIAKLGGLAKEKP
jgi:hypothetical protein